MASNKEMRGRNKQESNPEKKIHVNKLGINLYELDEVGFRNVK